MIDFIDRTFSKLFGRSDTDLEALANQPLETIARAVLKRKGDLDAAAVRVGMLGQTGTGKSSLINAILGREAATAGPTTGRHSADGEPYEYRGVTLVDLPGHGGNDYPDLDGYIKALKLLDAHRFDAFVLSTAERVLRQDTELYRRLRVTNNRPVFVVRTRFDLAVAGDRAEAVVREGVEKYLRAELSVPQADRVYMVSARYPGAFDLPTLIADLADCLPELKRVRLLGTVPPYTEALLRAKRGAVEEVALTFAFLAAVNAINPVAGVGVALDSGLMQQMTEKIIEAYGLTRSQLQQLAAGPLRAIPLDRVLDAAGPVLARLAVDGMAACLTQAATEAAAKRVAGDVGAFVLMNGRYAGLIGQLVSASLGFGAAWLYARHLMDECEVACRHILTAAHDSA